MPTTTPVPSKGALRALRSLALGTSCTLALSAGLLTEDRRRRIHAAREVHDNAKKLKSSRKYHSTGTTIIESLGDRSLRYPEEAIWLPSNVMKSAIPHLTTGKRMEDMNDKKDVSPSTPPTPPFRAPKYELGRMKRVPITNDEFGPPFAKPSPKSMNYTSTLGSPIVPQAPKQKLHNRQAKLAIDVTKLLQSPENIDEAISRFCEAFEEGLPIDGLGLSPCLMEVAIQLAKACEAQSKFTYSEKVFDIVRNAEEVLDEAQFHSFHPEAIIDRLLGHYHSSGDTSGLESLRKACSIFLTKYKEKPKPFSKRWLSQGERLCAKTCESGMYDLTLAIYDRMQSGREEGTIGTAAVGSLIIATHMKGKHNKVVGSLYYFLKTAPDQPQFFKVVSVALESILKTAKIYRAERALIAASDTAEKNGLSMSTTWILKVLGCDWRTHQNLEQTKSLFERLKPCLGVVQHPQAVYGAMIQFCIEANDEPLAQHYYENLRQLYPPLPGDVRIYGHFAFAKAKRNDWVGVKDDFLKMKSASSGDAYAAEMAASFLPILQLYHRFHSITDTEDFVRFFVDDIGISITTNLMNFMVNVYATAKEIDSLARWIAYAATAGCPMDSVSFNTILNKCSRSWEFPFWDTFRLYESVYKLAPGHNQYVDEDTLPILRRLAISKNPPQEELLRRFAALKKAGRIRVDTFDSKNVLRAMSVTLAKRDPVATLRIYETAQRDRTLLDARHLHLAIRASLQLNPSDAEEPLQHIQDAQQKGIDVSGAISIIMIQQMTAMCEEGVKDSRAVTELLQRTVTTLEGSGLAVSPAMVTHSMSVLQKRGHHRLCIEIWTALSRRLHIEPSSTNLVTLTILLKAYIGLEDRLGIQWVVKTLSANKFYPDARIRLYLKNARRETINLMNLGQYPDSIHSFLDTLDEAIETTRLLQEEVTKDRKEVKSRTIRIIQKAIADNNVAKGHVQASDDFSQKYEIGLLPKPDLNSPTIDDVERWTDRAGEVRHEIELLSPQVLVGAG